VPDVYQPGRVIVKTVARHPADKYKGMAQMLSARFVKKALQKGFNTMIHAYMHIENRSNKVSTNFGGGDNTRHHVLFKR
jgi:L-amino acid N-acyltransferase YncA